MAKCRKLPTCSWFHWTFALPFCCLAHASSARCLLSTRLRPSAPVFSVATRIIWNVGGWCSSRKQCVFLLFSLLDWFCMWWLFFIDFRQSLRNISSRLAQIISSCNYVKLLQGFSHMPLPGARIALDQTFWERLGVLQKALRHVVLWVTPIIVNYDSTNLLKHCFAVSCLSTFLKFCELHCAHVQPHKHSTTNGTARTPQRRDPHVVVSLLQLAMISHVSHWLRRRDRDRRPPCLDRAWCDGPGSAGTSYSSGLTAKGPARRKDTTLLLWGTYWREVTVTHARDDHGEKKAWWSHATRSAAGGRNCTLTLYNMQNLTPTHMFMSGGHNSLALCRCIPRVAESVVIFIFFHKHCRCHRSF